MPAPGAAWLMKEMIAQRVGRMGCLQPAVIPQRQQLPPLQQGRAPWGSVRVVRRSWTHKDCGWSKQGGIAVVASSGEGASLQEEGGDKASSPRKRGIAHKASAVATCSSFPYVACLAPLLRTYALFADEHVFTGAYRRRDWLSFEEAQAFVSEQGLTSFPEWAAWCKTSARPHNIPTKPHIVYRDQGSKTTIVP